MKEGLKRGWEVHSSEKEVFDKEKDLVSVVITNFNKWPYVQEAIENIAICQTYWPRELIIVDDGSSNIVKIKEVLAKLEGNRTPILYVPLPRRVGTAMAQNIGYALAKGEFIMNQDGDDLPKDKKIETQIKFLKEKNLDACGTNYEVFDSETLSRTGSGGEWLKFNKDQIRASYTLGHHCICWGTVMFRSKILNKVIGCSNSSPGAEDFDMCKRISDAGFEFGNLNEELYLYRASKAQRSRLYYTRKS